VLISGGRSAVRKVKRAQILLAADAGVSDEAIAASIAVGTTTVYKRRFVEGNLDAALAEQPRPGAARKLSGKEEALLVAARTRRKAARAGRWTCWRARSCD
jgi:transposase